MNQSEQLTLDPIVGTTAVRRRVTFNVGDVIACSPANKTYEVFVRPTKLVRNAQGQKVYGLSLVGSNGVREYVAEEVVEYSGDYLLLKSFSHLKK